MVWVVSDSLMYFDESCTPSWCRVQRHEYVRIAGRGPYRALLNVSIDFVVKATVDLYAPDGGGIPRWRWWLAGGAHNADNEATGNKTASSTGSTSMSQALDCGHSFVRRPAVVNAGVW